MAKTDFKFGTESNKEIAWHALPIDLVLNILNVDPDRGLTTKEAETRLEKYGYNEVPIRDAWWIKEPMRLSIYITMLKTNQRILLNILQKRNEIPNIDVTVYAVIYRTKNRLHLLQNHGPIEVQYTMTHKLFVVLVYTVHKILACLPWNRTEREEGRPFGSTVCYG